MARASSEEGRLRPNCLQQHIYFQARTISRAFRASGVAQGVGDTFGELLGKNISFVRSWGLWQPI